MRLKYTIITVTLIIFLIIIGWNLSWRMGVNERITSLSCISDQTLIHDNFTLAARYIFLFDKGKGSVRINGKTTLGDKTDTVSRQVFFSYSGVGDEYLLLSNQIEIFAADQSINTGIQKHLPSFFLEKDRQFAVTIHRDSFRNLIILFGDIPVFYCVAKGNASR